VAGLALGAVFVQKQRTLTDPLIDLRLFRVPAFSASVATNVLGFFGAFGAFLFLAQYLQLVHGLSPLRAGLWSLPSSAGFVVGSMLAPLIMRRVRPAFVVAGGMTVAAVGFGVLGQVGVDSGLALLVTGTAVFALGLAPVITVTTDLIVGTAPPERAGAASAISETGSEFGGALGIAVLGSIATAVYRREMADAIPAGVSPETTATARDTLGGAVSAAGSLPDPLGAELLDAAREAFVQGMQLISVIAAIGMAATALLAVLMLRHVGSGADPEAEPAVEFAAQGSSANAESEFRRATLTEPVQDGACDNPLVVFQASFATWIGERSFTAAQDDDGPAPVILSEREGSLSDAGCESALTLH
jgi:DHA2 family multidrug resistance protein-like MFS transporter